MSLIKNLRRTGPTREPWGRPLEVLVDVDVYKELAFSSKVSSRFVRMEFSHVELLPRI